MQNYFEYLNNFDLDYFDYCGVLRFFLLFCRFLFITVLLTSFAISQGPKKCWPQQIGQEKKNFTKANAEPSGSTMRHYLDLCPRKLNLTYSYIFFAGDH